MTNQEALYQALAQARVQRQRTEKIESIVGGILFSALGSCVLTTIVLWLTR